MAFQPCSREDLTREVRARYRANVLESPRPVSSCWDVLLVRNRDIQLQGRLSGMLVGRGRPRLPEPNSYPVSQIWLAFGR